MCGRYTLLSDLAALEERFGFDAQELVFQPRFNVAPTQQALTVTSSESSDSQPKVKNQARLMRWGLVPSWAKDLSIGNRMINARAETLAQKPSFRRALERRRCLVLADGFYEWQKNGKQRLPLRITLASGEPFGMAGLWESWQSPSGEVIQSCTIVTTSANELLAQIHHRMPVILLRELEAVWLDPDAKDVQLLSSLLSPYPAAEMQYSRVSTLVNSPANDSPDCIVPVPALMTEKG